MRKKRKEIKILEKKNKNDLKYNWLFMRLNNSILKDERVVKLPSIPTYNSK